MSSKNTLQKWRRNKDSLKIKQNKNTEKLQQKWTEGSQGLLKEVHGEGMWVRSKTCIYTKSSVKQNT